MTLVPGLSQLSADASSSSAQAPQPTDQVTTLGDTVPGLSELDGRGTALPSVAQKQAVARLGAVDVRWNQYGTPTSLLPTDGVLAPAASSDPVEAARSWLRSNAAVFGLTAAQVDDSSSSTTSASRRAAPTRCSSARCSATSPPPSTAW